MFEPFQIEFDGSFILYYSFSYFASSASSAPCPFHFPGIQILPTLSSVYLPAHRILRASEYMLLRECV